MFTRKEYMENKVSHEAYYGQFVTDKVKSIVSRYIGVEAIKNSKDGHFNDIPLRQWDVLHYSIMQECQKMLKEAGDVNANTLGNSVCIAKNAARMIRSE